VPTNVSLIVACSLLIDQYQVEILVSFSYAQVLQ